MEFVIKGGNKLGGTLRVNGSKNTALKLLSASLLSNGPVTLHNIPDVSDIGNIIALMESLGADVSFKNHTFQMASSQLKKHQLDVEIAKRLRASIILAVPVLLQLGEVTFPHPGGCVIGERPIDVF